MSRIAAAHVETIIVPKKVTIIVPKKVVVLYVEKIHVIASTSRSDTSLSGR